MASSCWQVYCEAMRRPQVSLRIVRAFVAMRKALASVAPILARLETVERRQIADQSRNEERFEAIFKAMDGGSMAKCGRDRLPHMNLTAVCFQSAQLFDNIGKILYVNFTL